MALASIQRLMKEHEAELLRERRSAHRKSFVRPIAIATGRNHDTLCDGFSRDISPIGIGLVTRTEWTMGTRAILTIHSLAKHVVRVSAEARWCQKYGEGWYLSGWRFLSEMPNHTLDET